MVINLDSLKNTVLSLFQMEWLLSYRINNEQYYKWQFDWAANQVTVRFDGAVTFLVKSIVCLTKCNSKLIMDYCYFINYYNYNHYYFQNEIHCYYYYYCEKCNRYYYYYNYPSSAPKPRTRDPSAASSLSVCQELCYTLFKLYQLSTLRSLVVNDWHIAKL